MILFIGDGLAGFGARGGGAFDLAGKVVGRWMGYGWAFGCWRELHGLLFISGAQILQRTRYEGRVDDLFYSILSFKEAILAVERDILQ